MKLNKNTKNKQMFFKKIMAIIGLCVISFTLISNTNIKTQAVTVTYNRQSTATVPKEYFGMIVNSQPGRPMTGVAGSVGSVRIWDTTCNAPLIWKYIEPTKGNFDWACLDAYVNDYFSRGLFVHITLGSGPDWAAAETTTLPCAYGGMSCNVPKVQDYKDYVSAVVNRYKGKIKSYSIWNEFDVFHSIQFWTWDKNVEMANLTRAAYEAIKPVDPAALVVSPSLGGFDSPDFGQQFLRKVLEAGAKNYVDVLAFHSYYGTKRSYIDEIEGWTNMCTIKKCTLWNDEFGQNNVTELPMMSKSLLTAWSLGVEKMYMYGYDFGNENFGLTTNQPTAFTHYNTTAKWMTGNKVIKTDYDDTTGNRIVHIQRPDNTMAYAVWNDNGTGTWNATGLNITTKQTLLAATSTYSAVSIPLTNEPVLYISGTTQTAIRVKPKIRLNGPWDNVGGKMKTTLKTQNLLPTTQPYNNIAFNYAGIEQYATINSGTLNAIDWVLIELRQDTDNNVTTETTLIKTKAVLLLEDGSLYDVADNSAGVGFAVTPANNYYLRIKHRNHLPISTDTPFAVISAADVTMDLSTKPLKLGNVDNNSGINSVDRSKIKQATDILNTYGILDINMDGKVSAADRTVAKTMTDAIAVLK
jgi:polysaccharide biosynthesis protein PslG